MYRFIFDMDNTLADFNAGGGLERMYDEGFFENLQPYPKGLELVKRFYEIGVEIFILSACIPTPHCKPEKMVWIEKNLPFIPKENVILIEVGKNKACEFIKHTGELITEDDLLFDDYHKNLQDWYEAGGTPVKCGKQKKKRKFKQLIKFSNIDEVLA
jgi:5'(3')-deoxyribonucleotidase